MSTRNLVPRADQEGEIGTSEKRWTRAAFEEVQTDRTVTEYTASIALGGHRVVLLDSSGKLIYADQSDLAHVGRVLGVTTQAIVGAARGWVQTYGELTEPTWSWALGPVYLSTLGQLTQTPPTTGFLNVVGFATSATTLFVRVEVPITLG